jgi:tetratricopeptide (TPR) repeat protein
MNPGQHACEPGRAGRWRRATHGLLAAALLASAAPAASQEAGGSSYQLNLALSRLAANPADAEALVAAGEAALALGDYDAAQDFLTRADGLWPRNPHIKADLATAMVRNGNPLEALRLFTEAERSGLNLAALAGERGLAYDLVGVASEAQRYYRQALSATPSDEIRRRLAISLAMSGERQQFEAVLLPQLQRQISAAWRTRAFGLAILGSEQEAIAVANRMMPAALAQQMGPYFRTMRRLTLAQQAAAAHLGQFPRPADIGRDDPRVSAFAALYPRKPAASDAAAVAPTTPGRSAKRASNERLRRAERLTRAERRGDGARSARQVADGATGALRDPGRSISVQALPPRPSSSPAPRLPLPVQPAAPIAAVRPPVIPATQAFALPPPATLAPQAPPHAFGLPAPAPATAMAGSAPATQAEAKTIHAAPPPGAMQQPPPGPANVAVFGQSAVMPAPFAGAPVATLAAPATSPAPLASVPPSAPLGPPSPAVAGIRPLATPTPLAPAAPTAFPGPAAPSAAGPAPAMVDPPLALPAVSPPVPAPAPASSAAAPGMASGLTATFRTFAPADGGTPAVPSAVPPLPPAQPTVSAARLDAPSMQPTQPRRVAAEPDMGQGGHGP